MDQRQDDFDAVFDEQEQSEDVWSEDGWYFDLPAGAWERQEAKNRALRDNIRANVKQDSILRAQDRRKNPFDVPSEHDLGGWADGLSEPGPNGRPVADVWGAEAEWPAGGAATAVTEAEAWEEAEGEAEPSDWDFADSPLALSPRSGSEPEAERWSAPSPERSDSTEPVAEASDVEAGAPRSRWDEMFGGPDAANGSVVDAMREWSSKAKEERDRERDVTRLDPALLAPFDWEENPAEGEATPAMPFTSLHDDEDDETPQGGEIEIVADESFDTNSWNEFSAGAAPEAPTGRKKGGLFSRVFSGRRDERETETPEWTRSGGGGWTAGIAANASSQWEKTDEPEPLAASDEWTNEGRDDDTPLGFRPSAASALLDPEGRMKGPADDSRAAAREVRTWGAPPTDDDGSVHYDLPKRFSGRNVWDDAWLEEGPPPGEEVDVTSERVAEVASLESSGIAVAEAAVGVATEAAGEEVAAFVAAEGAAEEAAAFVEPVQVEEWHGPAATDAVAEPLDGSEAIAEFGDYFDTDETVDGEAFAPMNGTLGAGPVDAASATVAEAPRAEAEPEMAVAEDAFAEETLPAEVQAEDAAGELDDTFFSDLAAADEAFEAESEAEPAAKYEESFAATYADSGEPILHADPVRQEPVLDTEGEQFQDEAREEPAKLELRAPEESEPPPDPPDDPWAAFLATQEGGGTRPFVSPATGTSGEPVSWNTNSKPGEAIDADMTSNEPGSQSSEHDPKDDQWAEIVAAAGYDDNPKVPIYTGRREPPVDPERRLPTDLLAAEPGPAARPQPDPFAEPFAGASAEPPPLESVDRFEAQPAWGDEDDVVLRAFDEHARGEPGRVAPTPAALFASQKPEAIDELLGAGADEIVDEAMSSLVEGSGDSPRNNRTEPMPWEDPPSAPPPVPVEEEGWDRRGSGFNDGDRDDDYYGRMPAFPGGEPLDPVEATVMRSPKRRGRTVARELVETLLLALLVFLAVRASFQNFKVDGNSMYPTLENGEFLIVNKLVYSEVDVDKLSRFLPFIDGGESPRRFVFHGPERGDIIVLQDPRQPEVDLIKRVIGLPGETVEIVNGTVFINGMLLEEPYIGQVWHYSGPPVALGSEEYFVMGDNRDNSKDSRSVGPIAKDLIIGKAMLTYWPAGDFGLAPNKSPKVTEKTITAYMEENGIAAVSR